jgi:hypothetical protein
MNKKLKIETMNKLRKYFILVIVFIPLLLSAQRKIGVHPCIDTSSIDVKNIIAFWKDYETDLEKYDRNLDETDWRDSNARMRNISLAENIKKKYWAESEIEKYDNIYYGLGFWNGLYSSNEEVIGILWLNDTLYELLISYYYPLLIEDEEGRFDASPDNRIYLSRIIKVLIVKRGSEYKLYQHFTFHTPVYNSYTTGWLTYYYPSDYSFDTLAAKTTFTRADAFAKNMGLDSVKKISYFLHSGAIIDMDNALGLLYRYIPYSYPQYKYRWRGGAANINGRSGYYDIHGEASSHEVLHVILADLYMVLNGKYEGKEIDEGICTYFGDDGADPYIPHPFTLFKELLNAHPEVDCGIHLIGKEYRLDSNNHFTTDPNVEDCQPTTKFRYRIDNYVMRAIFCEMVFKRGGVEAIKNMLIKFPQMMSEDCYPLIEEFLGVKRKNIDKTIRKYLNEHY